MEKYGFVYIWYDRKRKMYYVGCHWGYENDGYICSSRRMRDVYRRRPEDFKRRILSRIYTNRQDLLEEEHKWFQLIKPEELGKRYYNLRQHKWGHWSSDIVTRKTISEKIKEIHRNPEIKKLLSEQKLGDKNPMKRPEVAAKVSESLKNKYNNGYITWNKGIKTGPNLEHSKRMMGRLPPNKGKKMDFNKRESLSFSKNWIVIDPLGIEYTVTNLNLWCENKNLEATNLRSVAYGRRNHHKGYKCRKE